MTITINDSVKVSDVKKQIINGMYAAMEKSENVRFESQKAGASALIVYGKASDSAYIIVKSYGNVLCTCICQMNSEKEVKDAAHNIATAFVSARGLIFISNTIQIVKLDGFGENLMYVDHEGYDDISDQRLSYSMACCVDENDMALIVRIGNRLHSVCKSDEHHFTIWEMLTDRKSTNLTLDELDEFFYAHIKSELFA